jgi:hypothetical protein
MSNALRTIADSLAAGLKTVSFGVPSVTVERRNWVALDVEDMASPVVIVTPGNAEVTRIGRKVSQIDYTANVFVGQHVQTDSAVNAVMDLADEVMTQIRAHNWPESVSWPAGVTSPNAVTIEINPDDALSERNVWRAVVVGVYRVVVQD